MVSLGDNGFDSQAKENNENRCIPKGEYRAALVGSDRKETNDKKGAYLKLDFQILDGEFQNKHVFMNLNLWLDPSKSQAISIAKGHFSQLCRAVNVLTPKNSEELHNKPVIIKVKIDEDSEYGDQNNITGFKPAQSRVSPVVGAIVNSSSGNVASDTPNNVPANNNTAPLNW